MMVITGITGKVGGELGRSLLASGKRVRAVVRDEQRASQLGVLAARKPLGLGEVDLGDLP